MFSFKRVFEDVSDDFTAFCISITNSIYYVAMQKVVSMVDYQTKQIIDSVDLKSPILDLKVTQCGGFLLAGCGDRTGRVVDLKTKTMITLKGHAHYVNCIIECEDTDILTCSWDKTIRRWNRLTGECIRTYTGHGDFVKGIVYDKKTKRIFSGSNDYTIIVWNADTGEQIGVIKGHSHNVTCLAFVNATTIVSGSYDKTVILWDILTMKEVKTMSSRTCIFFCVAVTPDRQYVISGSFDNTVEVWSIATGKCVATIPDIDHSVGKVEVSADGKYVFIGFKFGNGYRIYEVEPAFNFIVHEFNTQIGDEQCLLKLLSDCSIVDERGEKI